jgi:hypothetical protein
MKMGIVVASRDACEVRRSVCGVRGCRVERCVPHPALRKVELQLSFPEVARREVIQLLVPYRPFSLH